VSHFLSKKHPGDHSIRHGSPSLLTQNPFYRNGKDHRSGWIVGFNDVRNQFQFKTIRIGRWVTPEEKEHTAPLFYDALCDLMDILGGDESLISLKSTLSLDYGIGGQPGVYAHYMPSTRCFALAKNAGPGSIAHEWFHAFDHYIADKAFKATYGNLFASDAWVKNRKPINHPLNNLLYQCFKTIMVEDDSNSLPSQLVKISKQTDIDNGSIYYSLPVELCARSFEAFVQDATIKNNFLVKGTKESPEAKQGLYPQGEQRHRINAAFHAYFTTLGQLLIKANSAT